MADTVYDLFRHDPEKGRSSHLHNHYRRGLMDVLPPGRGQVAAYAAWRAGRDTMRHEKGRST